MADVLFSGRQKRSPLFRQWQIALLRWKTLDCRHEVINGKPQLLHSVLFDLPISDDNFRAAANYTPQTAALEGKPRNDDFKANHRQNGQNAGQQGNGSVF